MTMLKSFSWATVLTTIVVAVIVVLVSSLFTGPSTRSVKDGYLLADSVLFLNGQKIVGDSLKNVHSRLTDLDSKLENKLTYASAYGLLSGESKDVIPSFIQMIELEINSTGAIVDTIDSYTELVPPVLNWRRWKEMKHIPTEVFASDTTKNEGKITIRQYFQPTFSTISKKSDTKKDTATPVTKPETTVKKKIIF